MRTQLILAKRDKKHANMLLFQAIIIDIQDKNLKFYPFSLHLRGVTKARKKQEHRSPGFRTNHRNSRNCKMSKACLLILGQEKKQLGSTDIRALLPVTSPNTDLSPESTGLQPQKHRTT